MPIGAAGYSGPDPTLRLARRVKLLTLAYPQLSSDAKLLESIAKSDLTDDAMVTQTGEYSRLKAFQRTADTMMQLDETTQRTYWSRMDPVARAGLSKLGYKVPTKKERGWFDMKIGPLDTADLGPAKFLPQFLIPTVAVKGAKEVFSTGMELLNKPLRASERAYRAASAMGGEVVDVSQQEGPRPQDRAGILMPSPNMGDWIGQTQQMIKNRKDVDPAVVEKARTEYATWLLEQALYQGKISQTDANRILKNGRLVQWSEEFDDPDMDKGHDLLRAYSGSWSDAWAGAEGEWLFRPSAVLSAQNLLDNDQGKLQIAARFANGEKIDEILAKRGLFPGTQEWALEGQRLLDLTTDKKMKKAIETLSSTRVSYGADMAYASGYEPGTKAFNNQVVAGNIGYMFFADPTLVGGKFVKMLRVARNVIKGGELSTEIAKFRGILADPEAYVDQFKGLRKVLARDEVTRAMGHQAAAERIADVFVNGGARQLLIEQPQLAPMLRAAAEENTRLQSLGDSLNSADQVWDLWESHTGIAEILQHAPRSYRYVPKGGVVLPKIDTVQATNGVIRGKISRGVDWLADLQSGGTAQQLGSFAGLNVRNVLGSYGKLLRTGMQIPLRSYVNLDDISAMKSFIDAGTFYGITSSRQAQMLDDIVRGTFRLADGSVVELGATKAARRAIMYRYINTMFDELGIRDLAQSDKTGRAKRYADDLLDRFKETFVYDNHGVNWASLPEQASNFMAIPNFADVVRASQLNTFLGKTYRFLNPGVLDWFMSRWRGITVMRPAMAVRAATEELLGTGIRFGWNHVFSAFATLPAAKGDISRALLQKLNAAKQAAATGIANADEVERLQNEYNAVRHAAGLKPIVASINFASSFLPGTAATNGVQQFTYWIADKGTEFLRNRLGEIGSLVDPINAIYMRRAAQSIFDLEHPAHAVYIEQAGIHSISGRNGDFDPSRMSLPLRTEEGMETINLSVGRGFEEQPTVVPDPVQVMSRVSVLSQLGGSVLTEQAMNTLARTVTPEVENALLGYLSRLPSWSTWNLGPNATFNDLKNKLWERLDEFPDDIQSMIVNVLKGDVEVSSKRAYLVSELNKLKAIPDDTSKMGQAKARVKGVVAPSQATINLRNSLLRELEILDGSTTAAVGTGGVLNEIKRRRIDQFGLDGIDANDAYKRLLNLRKKDQQAFADALNHIKLTFGTGATFAYDGPEKNAVETIIEIATNPGTDPFLAQAIKSTAFADVSRATARMRRDMRTFVDPNNNWHKLRNEAQTIMDSLLKGGEDGVGFRRREALLMRGGSLKVASDASRDPYLRQTLVNNILADMGNNQELLAQMDRSYAAVVDRTTGKTVPIAQPPREGQISVYYPVMDVDEAEIIGSLASYFSAQPNGIKELEDFADVLKIGMPNGTMRNLTYREKQIFIAMVESFDEAAFPAFKAHAAANGFSAVPISNIGVGDYQIAQEMADLARAVSLNPYERNSGLIAVLDVRNPKGTIEPATFQIGSPRKTFVNADEDALIVEGRTIAGSQVYQFNDDTYTKPLDGVVLTPATIDSPDGDSVITWTVGDPNTPKQIGTLRPGMSKEKSMRLWAEDIADNLLRNFSAPSGGVLHEVVNGIVREDKDVFSRIANLKVGDLETTTLVNRMYLDTRKPGWLNAALEYGFSKLVSPIITSMARNPLWLLNYGNALRVSDDVFNPMREGLEATRILNEWASANGIDRETIDNIWKSLHPADRVPNVSVKKIVDAFANHKATIVPTGPASATMAGIAITTEDAQLLRRNLSQIEHIDRLQQNSAIEQAMNLTIPYIDDNRIRSFASEYARGWSPFMYAEEQFLRRWARTLTYDPTAIHKAQLYLGVGESIGFTHEDPETGRVYFVYPLVGPAFEMFSNAPFVDRVFGGNAILPKGLEFQQDVTTAIPGFSGAGEFSFGPAMQLVSRAAALFWPEAGEQLYASTSKGRSITDSVLMSFMPGWLMNLVKTTGVIDDSEELNRLTVQSAQMLAAEGNELLREAADAEAAGQKKKAERLRNRAFEMLPPARRNGKDPNAEDWERYTDMIRATGRVIMVSRAATHFGAWGAGKLGGTQIEMTREWQQELSVIDPTEENGYGKALGRFIARYPDAYPFTIKGRVSESRAPLPNTAYAVQWMTEHQDLLRKYPEASPWLVEPDPSGDRDPRAWIAERAYGLYKQRDGKEWAREYYRAKGAQVYYPLHDEYKARMEALPDSATSAKRRLREEWAELRDEILKRYPVFAEERASPDAGNRRNRQRTTILAMAENDELPDTMFARNIAGMVQDFNNYRSMLDSLKSDRTRRGDRQREAIREEFRLYIDGVLKANPELGGFWNSVIRPDADLED